MLAAKHGSRVLRPLVGVSCDLEATNNSGETALMMACGWGNIESMGYLIEAKASVNTPTTSPLGTVLLKAILRDNPQMTYILLEAKADIHSSIGILANHRRVYGSRNVRRERQYTTPIQFAAKNRSDKSFALLVKYGARVSGQMMCEAAAEGRISILAHAIKYGAIDPDVRSTETGHTPLIAATRCGNIDVMRFLVEEAGADVDAVDDDDQPALLHAALRPVGTAGQRFKVQPFRLLLSLNASLTQSSSRMTTCIGGSSSSSCGGGGGGGGGATATALVAAAIAQTTGKRSSSQAEAATPPPTILERCAEIWPVARELALADVLLPRALARDLTGLRMLHADVTAAVVGEPTTW